MLYILLKPDILFPLPDRSVTYYLWSARAVLLGERLVMTS